MTSERRRQLRFVGPFEATWSGTSGHRSVRVPDFSTTGCFIEDTAPPAIGEAVIVTLRLPGGPPISARGRVVYLHAGHGFAVTFEADDQVSSELHAAARRLSLAAAEGPPASRDRPD
jgi:hypothetical protein